MALLRDRSGRDVDIVKLSIEHAIVIRRDWERWQRPGTDWGAGGQGIVGSIASGNVGVVGILGIAAWGKVIKDAPKSITDNFIVVDHIVKSRAAGCKWQAD